jgi:hypothetical protein
MNDTDLAKLAAAVKLLYRTGAQTYRAGYSDPDDGEPTVWYACAVWPSGRADAGAGLNPLTATLHLCEQVIDGGECTHCGQVTMFAADADDRILNRLGCVYAWDPELSTFRRGCEGDHSDSEPPT